MNQWTQRSIDIARTENYLDRLYAVYPSDPESERQMDADAQATIEEAFANKDNASLIRTLLDMPLFPLKDSYVAFLKQDREAIMRNPETINRLSERIYEMSIHKLMEEVKKPKEANRQMGQRFRNWLLSENLGVPCLSVDDFAATTENCILSGGDAILADFARKELNYRPPNGLDLVAKFNNRYVIGEAKFITASGGHQDRQFESATAIFNDPASAYKVAILDGILYIPNKGRMYQYLCNNPQHPVFSVLLLREFLEAI